MINDDQTTSLRGEFVFLNTLGLVLAPQRGAQSAPKSLFKGRLGLEMPLLDVRWQRKVSLSKDSYEPVALERCRYEV